MNNYLSKNVIFILAVSILIVVNASAFYALLQNRYFIYEPDAYLHMVLARDFITHPQWYNTINHSINAPFGADTHGWTQIVTLLLISGTYCLKLFFSLQDALYLWSFVVPLLFNLLAAFLLVWSLSPLKPTRWQQLFLVIAFLVNPFMHSLYLPLRVDYDFLLIFISIFYWGCFLRIIQCQAIYWSIIAALVAVLGMWTSIAFIIPLLLSLAVLGWLSFVNLRLPIYLLYWFLATICIGLGLVIPIEHSYFFTIAYDIVSIVYLTFFVLVLVGLYLYECLLKPLKRGYHCIVLGSIALVIFIFMNYLFPGFYHGPYNEVSPYVLQHFFPVVSEFYSPFALDDGLVLALSVYYILGAGYLFYLYLDKKLSQNRLIILFLATALTLFTGIMYRWNEFATPLNILLISFLIADFCAKKQRIVVKGAFVVLLALLPSSLIFFVKDIVSIEEQHCEEQLHLMLQDKFLEQIQFQQDKIVFIHSNYGPLVLYGTHLAVIGTNDHHNPQGLIDSMSFFTEKEQEAYKMLKKRGVNLVLLCTAQLPQFNVKNSTWLKPVPLPLNYSNWQLYRRLGGESAAP